MRSGLPSNGVADDFDDEENARAGLALRRDATRCRAAAGARPLTTSTPSSSPSSGAPSGRSAAAAPSPVPASSATRRPITWAPPAAACGRPTTWASAGATSPTAIFKTGSVGAIAVAESDPNVVYVGMGEHALARRHDALTATACTDPPTPGKTWKNDRASSETQHISRDHRASEEPGPGATWRRREPSTAPDSSAASSSPPTAARRGRTCCSSTTRPARRSCRWTPPTRASCTPRCGSTAGCPGRSSAAAPAAASTNPPTAARPGSG